MVCVEDVGDGDEMMALMMRVEVDIQFEAVGFVASTL